MTIYTWKIINLLTVSELNGQSDVVVVLNYQVAGNDDINTVTYQRDMSVNYASGSPFTSFSNLTETEVIGWAQENLGQNAIIGIENYLQEKLNELANPAPIAASQALPWLA